jgi:hypothetical protein
MEHVLTESQIAILLPLLQEQFELRQTIEKSQRLVEKNQKGVVELAGLIAAGANVDSTNPHFEQREGVWYLVTGDEAG